MRTSISISSVTVVVGFTLGVTAGACRSDLPNHCANLDEDATCRERGQGQFCNACVLDNDGCVNVMPSPECHDAGDPPGESSSGSGSSGTEGTTDVPSGSDTEPTTGTTSDGPCVANEDCTDAAAPLCGPEGMCVRCDAMPEPDAACAGLDPTAPVCDAGECVQCSADDTSACTDTTPVCDAEARVCVACTSHAQCPDSACHEAEGSCLPSDAVWVVDRDGGADFDSIGAALGQIAAGEAGTIIVRDSAGAYAENVVIGGDRVVAVLAETVSEATRPQISINGSAPMIYVDGGATVYIDGLELRGNTLGAGMEIDGSTLYLDRSEIVANNQGAIIAGAGSTLLLRNCTAGGDVNNVAAVQTTDADLSVLYSTLAGGFGMSSALTCSGGTVEVRNSILVSESADPELSCPGATVTYSASEVIISGEGNAELGDLNTAWFVNYGQGNLRLSATGQVEVQDVALWTLGDPATDLDGDPRPMTDGTADYAGADVP